MTRHLYFTVEVACPDEGWSRLPHLTAQARHASEELEREGVSVRFLRSIFVPEDETCFYLYRADSAEVVSEAVRRAELSVEHVAGTVTVEAARSNSATLVAPDVVTGMDVGALEAVAPPEGGRT